MRVYYFKLVRDRIPQIIARRRQHYEVEKLADDQYREALWKKLVEECNEAADAATQPKPSEHLYVELADVLEVVDAIVKEYGLDPVALIARQVERRKARGGFDERLRLVWAEAHE
jgi:predicted house-cleaning noncanonical NTP pyrophosphatase (MazG superfamily)